MKALEWYTSKRMSTKDDNVLDKAEAAARRLLERLGSKPEGRLDSGARKLGPAEVEARESRVELGIESALERRKGSPPVAPNSFTISLTYEQSRELSDQALNALAVELEGCAREFMNNRRYSTIGPVKLEVNRDVFVQDASIKTGFEAGTSLDARERQGTSKIEQPSKTKTLRLAVQGQPEFKLVLTPGGAPLSIGRAAGNALRLEDESVSRIHCSISLLSDSRLLLSDLNSVNGTSVNGRLLHRGETHTIATGDSIAVGDVQIKVIEIG